MNKILWHMGYPMLIIEYKKRKSYYTALGLTSNSEFHSFSKLFAFLEKDEERFVKYFMRRYLSVHKKRLE